MTMKNIGPNELSEPRPNDHFSGQKMPRIILGRIGDGIGIDVRSCVLRDPIDRHDLHIIHVDMDRVELLGVVSDDPLFNGMRFWC